jgi:hypothetical protein
VKKNLTALINRKNPISPRDIESPFINDVDERDYIQSRHMIKKSKVTIKKTQAPLLNARSHQMSVPNVEYRGENLFNKTAD